VHRIVDDAHEQVTQLLTEHRDQLDNLSHALLEAETLDAPTLTPPRASRCARLNWRPPRPRNRAAYALTGIEAVCLFLWAGG
jgi:hypothetical protein